MKLISALVVTMTATFSAAFAPFSDAPTRATGTTWADVANFIAAHAVNSDPVAEGALCFESAIGIQTWTVTGGSANALRPDGPAIGWPQAGAKIEFETIAEAEMAAELVLDLTFGG